MKIVIYTKSGCSYCKKAKKWFKEQGINYDMRIINNPVKRERFYADQGPNVNTMPQIFLDDVRIGGYTELIKNSELILSEFGGLMTQSKTYKPFLYPWAVDLCVESERMHWIEDEIDLSEDVTQWKKGVVTDNEKDFIVNILRLFTQGDVAVGQNYVDYFIPRIKNNEVRNLLVSIAAREGIHQRAYALLNDTLGLADKEYHAFLDYKEMTDKVDWMQDNDISSFRGMGLSFAKTVFTEGVSLFASFAMLLNFQRFGKLKGTGKIVEWSLKDESVHVTSMTMLYRTFCEEHPRIVTDEFIKTIYAMATKVVRLEEAFIDMVFSDYVIEGLTKEELKEYIRYITDRRLIGLGLKGKFKVKENPIPWLEWLVNATDHTNFFENKVTEYDVAGLQGTWDYSFIDIDYET